MTTKPTTDTKTLSALKEDPAEALIPQDEIADETLKEIGALIAGGKSTAQISKLIGQPPAKIMMRLRAERHRMALLLLPWASKKLIGTAVHAQGVLDAVIAEIEDRIADGALETLNWNELLKLGTAMAALVNPVHQRLAFGPLKTNDSSEDKSAVSIDTVNLLINRIAQAKESEEIDIT